MIAIIEIPFWKELISNEENGLIEMWNYEYPVGGRTDVEERERERKDEWWMNGMKKKVDNLLMKRYTNDETGNTIHTIS